VASIAADEVKKSVLELGGSDAFLVMSSADVARAARVAVTARVQNNGQSCIAAKRFIVHEDVYEAFAEAFVEAMAGLTVGDPLRQGTDVGPLATEDGRADLEELVDDALRHGAKAECGGQRPAALGAGWYYEPTVLTGITPQMRIHREECFGPVATLYRVASLDEAVALANDTPFGLSSNAWTTDRDEQIRLARDLEAGAVFFNGMTASHPALPFGGVKRSGFGRELSEHGIREFCNVTTLWYGPGSGHAPDTEG
jgi:succinate-semialdehyde dehydrogenase/glutarate-semialdehyde dehydrogenase